jgi:hypothetical protein
MLSHTNAIYVHVEMYQRNMCYIMLGVSYQSDIPVRLTIKERLEQYSFLVGYKLLLTLYILAGCSPPEQFLLMCAAKLIVV